MEVRETVECYELDRELKKQKTVETDDGWVIEYRGDRNNSRSQSITATKDGKQITLSTYWGSEGIALTLLKARNDNLSSSKHHT